MNGICENFRQPGAKRILRKLLCVDQGSTFTILQSPLHTKIVLICPLGGTKISQIFRKIVANLQFIQ